MTRGVPPSDAVGRHMVTDSMHLVIRDGCWTTLDRTASSSAGPTPARMGH